MYLEGPPKRSTYHALDASNSSESDATIARTGGKGGGRWLFTSHEPVNLNDYFADGDLLGPLGLHSDMDMSYPHTTERPQYIHFKFEPMILHILTESVKEAQLALNAALAAGFRESGISGILDNKGHQANPMVAVRSSGLAMDSIIGFQTSRDGIESMCPMVSEAHLRILAQVANERFEVNTQRMERFRQAFVEQVSCGSLNGESAFEPADVRKERKRREGLLHQQAVRDNRKMNRVSDDQQSAVEQDRAGDDVLGLELLGTWK